MGAVSIRVCPPQSPSLGQWRNVFLSNNNIRILAYRANFGNKNSKKDYYEWNSVRGV